MKVSKRSINQHSKYTFSILLPHFHFKNVHKLHFYNVYLYSFTQKYSIAHDVGTEVPQKVGSVALNATTTRQSLVKGERLVRDVVTAAIPAFPTASSYPS